jgi:LPXTG-motif cell wall-anchored protein
VAAPSPDAQAAAPVGPEPEPTLAAPQDAVTTRRPPWLWPLLIGLIVLAGAGLFVWRRRRGDTPIEPFVPHETIAPELPPADAVTPTAAVTPVMAAAAAPRFLDQAAAEPAARIDLDEPAVSRAGVNMVTATADVTVVVRNPSDVPARGIALDIRLTSAQPGQDAAIAAMFAAPVVRPATPPFDLAPGETKRVRALATMPRDSITVLQAGGRPMFVPVVAIRAVHAGGQTVSVHALGIERPGQAKLGPFWLDQPMRMFDTIGVRPHTGR